MHNKRPHGLHSLCRLSADRRGCKRGFHLHAEVRWLGSRFACVGNITVHAHVQLRCSTNVMRELPTAGLSKRTIQHASGMRQAVG